MRAPHVIALTREIISMGIHSLDSFGVRRTISVGGIEAASAILGEPISMVIPEVVGCDRQAADGGHLHGPCAFGDAAPCAGP